MKKKEVQIKTIKYNDEELPILVNFGGNSYLIHEIKSHEENQVFHGGGIGTKWTIVVNGKETLLHRDKHNLKWYVYVEGYDSPHKNHVNESMDYDDYGYLN